MIPTLGRIKARPHAQPPYREAVIGRTGRGDYGHGLDLALLGHPRLQVVAVADEDKDGRAAAAKRLGVAHAYGDYRTMVLACYASRKFNGPVPLPLAERTRHPLA